jgi:hypothetical protein
MERMHTIIKGDIRHKLIEQAGKSEGTALKITMLELLYVIWELELVSCIFLSIRDLI